MSKSQRPFVPPSGALRFAEVALDRPLDHNLTYSIPEALAEQLRVGSLVEVPLRSQTARGVVNAINTEAGFRGAVKSVARLLTPEYSINPEVMHLGRWMAGYYRCALGEALAAISFVGLNDVHALMKSHLALSHPDHWLAVSREAGPEGKKVTPKQAQVIHTLLARGNDPLSGVELREEAGVSESVIQTMLERKWLVRVQEPVEREDDYPAETRHEFSLPSLTPAQTAAVETILKSVHDGRHQTFLLHGVTGSGKTEVYLRVISDALRLGKTAIVLVPEIALTPQTVGNFRSRLGPQVGVYHSRLTLGQKFDLWKKIAAGEVRVLIGARSAVFAPMPNLGVIVADEEHETTFKQGETPRYHARDVAVWRMFQRAGVAILGSATPSMESFHNAHEGKYSLLELPERIGPHASPAMTIIDMKRHFLE
ncbi:primosomal protein N', partial [Candidatus Sumerlaeota bacterium]|nr:primosomal protein N' [Candidatus Sumerlaeota bacterium]